MEFLFSDEQEDPFHLEVAWVKEALAAGPDEAHCVAFICKSPCV
jgi:hypothetical protein